MQRIWILAADASRARLFERSLPDQPLHEIQDFSNPAGRAHDRDLRSDAEGRYGGGGQGRQAHTAPRHVDASEHEAERFSKRVSEFIEHARALHRFERLYLVGAPRFLGRLRKVLSKQVHQVVADEIPKDVSRCGPQEIERVVRTSTERAAL